MPFKFQDQAVAWCREVFGADTLCDVNERAMLFVEESLELAQACGVSAEQAHRAVDYVFDRGRGEVEREVGGVMITLSALCEATRVRLWGSALIELDRIQDPAVIKRCQRRQAEKRAAMGRRHAV